MTETTPSDPQVEPDEDPRRDALRCVECEFRTDDSPGGWYELSEHRTATGHRYEHVRPARRPPTMADIPAGQGPASLFLTPHDADDGGPQVWFKAHDGRLAPVSIDGAGYRTEVKAMREHLAATLPTVTD